MGENHTKQSHRSIDDRHTQRERSWDGLPYRDTQVDGGGVVFQSSAARRTVGLQLQFTKKIWVILTPIAQTKTMYRKSDNNSGDHCCYYQNIIRISVQLSFVETHIFTDLILYGFVVSLLQPGAHEHTVVIVTE